MMANGVGIIDADYYNNPDNEGHIFLQLFNISPFNLYVKKGEILAQGIVKPYLTFPNDEATGERLGGFGSTSV
jgi:dUTP pyrophosphatase